MLHKASLTMRLHVQLFQAFDAAVRGLSLGETTTLEAKGGEWRRDLLFEVRAVPTHSLALHACLSTPVPCLLQSGFVIAAGKCALQC